MWTFRPLRLRDLAPTACVAAISAASVEVSAQQSTALDRFDPAPALDPFFAVPSAEVRGAFRPFGGATFSYADAPLIAVRSGNAGEDKAVGDIVSSQSILHLGGGLALFDAVLLHVSLPVVLAQAGDDTPVALAPEASAALADLRLGGRVELLDRVDLWPAAALALDVWVPTAADDAYAGAGVARFAPRLVLGVEHPSVAWAVTTATRLLPFAADSLLRSEIEAGAAGGPVFGPLWVGPEVVLRVGIEARPGEARQVSGEARLGAKLALGPLQAGLAAGPGLGDGYGTPAFRVLGSIAIATDPGERSRPSESPAATDAPANAAPAPRAETGRHPAGAKAVPGAAQATAVPTRASDSDADGVADASDACPDVRGVVSLDAKLHGCPKTVDGDGDGVADGDDACPTEKGSASSDRATSGCPTSVRLDGSQIVILQQVQFEVGAAKIAPASDALLTEVARVMIEHEEIARIAVDGHTDGRGDARANLLLSQKRALAVVAWLTEHGVDARRLEARGYGPRQPIADDATPEGRAKNRRVEFIVRKRTTLGKEGWTDGPID